MGIKKYNPYTPSRRHMTGSDFSEITKKTPEKSLISATMNKQAGRNNQGKITVRHRGGGAKRKYRIIDFKRNSKDGIPATVIGIEYDPNRTANIALICYADGTDVYKRQGLERIRIRVKEIQKEYHRHDRNAGLEQKRRL